MLEQFKNIKPPILVLSAPRTGGTYISQHISEVIGNGCVYIHEPDNAGKEPNPNIDVKEFTKLFYTNKNFVLKLIHTRIPYYDKDIMNWLFNNAYKVRIRRKNFIEQAASFYVASKLGKFVTYKIHENLNMPAIDIDMNHISVCVMLQRNLNIIINNSPYKYDLDLVYEDCQDLAQNKFIKSNKPANYNQILELIHQKIKELNLSTNALEL